MSGNSGSPERGAHVRCLPLLVFFLFIGVGVALQHGGWRWPVVLPRGVQLAAGSVGLALGLALEIAANVQFRGNRQNPLPWKPAPELLASGVYRFTRNPMYVGGVLIQIGTGLLANNGWVIAFAAPALLWVHHAAVLREEEYLAARFGDAYRAYCLRVRRYL